MTRWFMRLWEFEFNIIHSARVKHQATNARSHVTAKEENKKPLNDEVPSLTIPKTLFPCAPNMGMTGSEFIQERNGPFIVFIPEACMMAGVTDNQKAVIETLAELASAQSSTGTVIQRSDPLKSRTLVLTSIAMELSSMSFL